MVHPVKPVVTETPVKDTKQTIHWEPPNPKINPWISGLKNIVASEEMVSLNIICKFASDANSVRNLVSDQTGESHLHCIIMCFFNSFI